jgi:hypothetical protein
VSFTNCNNDETVGDVVPQGFYLQLSFHGGVTSCGTQNVLV